MEFNYDLTIDPNAENNTHAFALSMIGHNKTVLEVGCATGYFTKVLVEYGCKVVAPRAGNSTPCAPTADQERRRAPYVVYRPAAMPAIGACKRTPPAFPRNGAGPKLNTAPFDATSQ